MSSKFLFHLHIQSKLNVLCAVLSALLKSITRNVRSSLRARTTPHLLLALTWQAVVSSCCQLVLIMMANSFLVARCVLTRLSGGCQVDCLYIISIYSLTRSRLQSGLVLAFSAIAFIIGIVTIATTWTSKAYGCCALKCSKFY